MSSRRRVRVAMMGLGLASLGGYAVGFPWVNGWGERSLVGFVGLSIGLFALYLTAAWVVRRGPADDRVLIVVILGFGLLFRLAMLPTPVVLSSDVYRYLWDGRVQRAGISPYRYPPAAPELTALRDATVYPHVNRPGKRTVYPPGAELLFLAATAITPGGLTAWRLFLLGCEVATVVLLLRLLRRLRVAPTAVVFYAWAPLVVFEGVHAGHLEVAFLPAVLLALLWRQTGRMARAGVALGVAVLVKLYPAVLLVAWWRRGDWRLPLACAGLVAAAYLPYAWGTGAGVVGFLPEYFSRGEDFNIGLRFFLTGWIPVASSGVRETVRAATMILLFGALAAALLTIARRRREDPRGVFDAGMAAAGAYLVLVPTAAHAWYAVWIVPFLAVRPSPAWLWFTGAVPLSYLKYTPVGLPLWIRALEYLPLYALLLWEAWAGRTRGLGGVPGVPWKPGEVSSGPSRVA